MPNLWSILLLLFKKEQCFDLFCQICMHVSLVPPLSLLKMNKISYLLVQVFAGSNVTRSCKSGDAIKKKNSLGFVLIPHYFKSYNLMMYNSIIISNSLLSRCPIINLIEDTIKKKIINTTPFCTSQPYLTLWFYTTGLTF